MRMRLCPYNQVTRNFCWVPSESIVLMKLKPLFQCMTVFRCTYTCVYACRCQQTISGYNSSLSAVYLVFRQHFTVLGLVNPELSGNIFKVWDQVHPCGHLFLLGPISAETSLCYFDAEGLKSPINYNKTTKARETSLLGICGVHGDNSLSCVFGGDPKKIEGELTWNSLWPLQLCGIYSLLCLTPC